MSSMTAHRTKAPRNYQREEENRQTKAVLVRLPLEHVVDLEELKARGYSYAQILAEGIASLKAKTQ